MFFFAVFVVMGMLLVDTVITVCINKYLYIVVQIKNR